MIKQRTNIAELQSITTHLRSTDRVRALRQILDHPIENPAGWYLLGKEMVQANDLNAAARAFGMAYHQDVDLTSAAVLTFSCLKAARSMQPELKSQFIQTWIEMKSPALARNISERAILKLIDAEADREDDHDGWTAERFFDCYLAS